MCINVPPPIPAMQPPNAPIAFGKNRSKNRSKLSGAHPAGCVYQYALMCNVEHHVFVFTELEVLLAMVGAAATRLKQRLDLIYGN